MQRARCLRVVIALAPFLVCVLLYAPTLSGAFVSDDYAVLAALSDWSKEGRLVPALLAKFHSGLDSPSFYYRPLSMLSFGVNFAMGGGSPLAWRVTNLALHLASGILVWVVVQMLVVKTGGVRTVSAPALATGAFLLCPTSPEVVAWVSGRYDVLALAFTLATIALFLRSVRWTDRWGIAALLAAVCALASKESAVIVPALVYAIALARLAAQPDVTAARIALDAARKAAPWILLGVGYLALRAMIFGNAFQVYAGTSPLRSLASGAWTAALTSSGAWVAAALPLPIVREVLLLAVALLVVLGAWVSWRTRAMRATWLAIFFSAILSLTLLLPHLSALSASGEQGRLFYTTSSLLSVLIGLGVAAAISKPLSRSGVTTIVLISVALLTAEVLLLRAAIAPWQAAGAQLRQLAAALPVTADAIPASGYGLVLVPDHLGSAPFGRNAQGGLVLPPTQSAPLSQKLIVQTSSDLAAWPENAGRGLVDALRRFPLDQVWGAVTSGAAVGSALPTEYFCWDDKSARIVALPLSNDIARIDWIVAWRRVLAKTTCGEVAAEVAVE